MCRNGGQTRDLQPAISVRVQFGHLDYQLTTRNNWLVHVPVALADVPSVLTAGPAERGTEEEKINLMLIKTLEAAGRHSLPILLVFQMLAVQQTILVQNDSLIVAVQLTMLVQGRAYFLAAVAVLVHKRHEPVMWIIFNLLHLIIHLLQIVVAS